MRCARWVGLSVFSLALATWACGDRAESEAAAAAAAPTANLTLYTADTATVAVPLSLTAQVYVEHDAYVYARTTGIAESIVVDLGSEVRAGDVLAQLENVDQTIALGQAEVAYDNARREAERARQLAGRQLVATADSERAEVEFRRADLALQQARRNYALTRVTAPFAGVVAARVLRAGRLVNPGDSLFRVTATAPLLVAVHVPEETARNLGVGAVGLVQATDGGAARATVIRASPNIDPASGTRELVLQLGVGSRLRPGASVTVRLGAERRRVVTLPGGALADSGFVLVWQDGRTVMRAVTLGARLPDGRVEVVSGLSAGERVARPLP